MTRLGAAWVVVAAGVVAGCKGRFSLPADARFVAQVVLGDDFGCARMKDGSIRCWGANDAGELGDGTHQARGESVRVVGTGPVAQVVGAGGQQACALAPDLACWGATATGSAAASALPEGVKDLAVGAHHVCVLRGGGDVLCRGAADAGQLGGGSGKDPVVRGATFVAAGGDATCAVLRDRSLACWGRVPGLGVVPVTRIEGLADVVDVAVSDTHACAVRAWGGIACWGRGGEGELGDGTLEDRTAPTDVTGLAVPARAVATGRGHTCALLRDGTVHCWGDNASAQMADGTTVRRPVPELVNGVFEVEAIAAAADATCARLSDGSARCWGGLTLPKTPGQRIPVPTEVRW